MSVIKDISKRLGLSESTVEKIISDPFDFSDKTSGEVLKLYNAAKKENASAGTAIGVLVPKRPIYFWKDVTAGMTDAVKASGRNIRLNFFYYTQDLEMPISECGMQSCEGYIYYPSDMLDPAITEMMNARPRVVLNEENSDQCLFIGPDGYDEGAKAAGILKGQDISHIAVVRFQGKTTVEKRVAGFADTVKSMMPEVKITVVQLNSIKNIASARLAKKLADAGYPDCVYITTGASYVGGGAIAKLREKTDKRMVLIGHELCHADRKYLLDGTMLGYVIQDAYTQGYCSVELLLRALDGEKAQSRYVESKVVLAER